MLFVEIFSVLFHYLTFSLMDSDIRANNRVFYKICIVINTWYRIIYHNVSDSAFVFAC